jgi:hypothetical protein
MEVAAKWVGGWLVTQAGSRRRVPGRRDGSRRSDWVGSILWAGRLVVQKVPGEQVEQARSLGASLVMLVFWNGE